MYSQMSGLRMKVAGRFKPCAHMGCFDLDVFVEMNQRSRKASKYETLFSLFCFHDKVYPVSLGKRVIWHSNRT